MYIYCHPQTVSVWLNTQDASSWDRNLSNFMLDLVSYSSATGNLRQLGNQNVLCISFRLFRFCAIEYQSAQFVRRALYYASGWDRNQSNFTSDCWHTPKTSLLLNVSLGIYTNALNFVCLHFAAIGYRSSQFIWQPLTPSPKWARVGEMYRNEKKKSCEWFHLLNNLSTLNISVFLDLHRDV